jgi:hypothetical protein
LWRVPMNNPNNATSNWLADIVAVANRVGGTSLTMNVPLPALLDAVACTHEWTSVSYLADGRLLAQMTTHVNGTYVALSTYVASVDGRAVPPHVEDGWTGLRLPADDAHLLVALPGGDR